MRYSNWLTIFLIALFLRLGIVIFSREIPSFDAAGYDSRAISILQGKGFSDNGKPTAFKEPLYSFFLAGIYYFLGHSYLAVRILQAVLGAFGCILIFFIGKRLFNERVAILSGLIAGINPSFIKASEHLLTETLFSLILVLIIVYSLKLVKHLCVSSSSALGFLLGIGSLTRSVLVIYVILTCIVLFLLLNKNWPLRQISVNIFVICFCFLISILPWTARNWIIFHDLVPISTNVGINMYSSYFPPEGKLFGFTASDETTKLAARFSTEPEQSKFLLHKTIEKVKKLKPIQILKLELLKLAYFWCPLDWEIIGGGCYNFVYGFILPFFIFSIIFLIKRLKELVFLYLPIIYFTGIALVTYGSPRFRLPVEPYIILFASYGICDLWTRFNNRKMAYYSFLAWLIINLEIYYNCTQIKSILKKWISF